MNSPCKDLVSAMNIETETPYVAELSGTDHYGEYHENKGAVVFSLEMGRLKYKFTPTADDVWIHSKYKLLSASDLRLAVPSQGFDNPARTTLYPSLDGPAEGVLTLEYFGDANAELRFVSLKFKNLPDHWHSIDDVWEVRDFRDEPPVPDENGLISLRRPGWYRTPAIKLEWSSGQGETWTINLRRIPVDQRDSDHNFECTISVDGALLTGGIAQEFLKENLRPFLQFTFAGRADNHIVVGYDGYNKPMWGLQIRDTGVDIPGEWHSHNWFLRPPHVDADINPQFRAFCDLDVKNKKAYQRVIETYASSEKVFCLVGSSAIAASLSYAALDSLARAITAEYPDSKEWLEDNLEVKRGKRLKEVIELVALRELNENEAFKQVSQIVAAIRHNTFHADPTKEPPDWTESRNQWDNNQTMVEMLLLKRLGMKSIPIRASVPTFLIHGKDMLAQARQSSIADKLASRSDADGT